MKILFLFQFFLIIFTIIFSISIYVLFSLIPYFISRIRNTGYQKHIALFSIILGWSFFPWIIILISSLILKKEDGGYKQESLTLENTKKYAKDFLKQLGDNF